MRDQLLILKDFVIELSLIIAASGDGLSSGFPTDETLAMAKQTKHPDAQALHTFSMRTWQHTRDPDAADIVRYMRENLSKHIESLIDRICSNKTTPSFSVIQLHAFLVDTDKRSDNPNSYLDPSFVNNLFILALTRQLNMTLKALNQKTYTALQPAIAKIDDYSASEILPTFMQTMHVNTSSSSIASILRFFSPAFSPVTEEQQPLLANAHKTGENPDANSNLCPGTLR